MKKILFITFVLGLVASSASAHDMAKRTALGFVDSSTPIGIRHWFGPKLGLDVGFGISSTQQETSPGTKTTYTNYQVSVGLPINLLSVGDRVNLHLLPMFEYRTIDQGTDNETQYDIIGALEFEVFVTKDLSVSASQGIAFTSSNPPGTAESTADWSTFGSNITEFGVHYYLPGGGGETGSQ
jgi:hypothetical protein